MRPSLLPAGRGGGAFAPVGGGLPEPVQFFASPKGGTIMSQDPRAFYANGKTHFGWSNSSTGGVEVATYDHTSRSVGSSNELHDFGAAESHYSTPLIVRLSDSKIVALATGHSFTPVIRGISLSANDVAGAWPTLTDISGSLGSNGVQFGTILQLDGIANDPIHIFWEDRIGSGPITSRLAHSVSTDSGSTFAALGIWFSRTNSGFPAWRIGSDWDTRIDVWVSPTDSYSTDPSLYHFYYDASAGTFHQSDGTSMGSPPFDTTAMTLVYDGSSGGVFPARLLTNGGLPVGVFYAKVDSTHNACKRARWTGSAWAIDTVLAEQAAYVGDRFSTGLTILDDAETVYLGDAVDGNTEIFRYRSGDGGTSWDRQQLTFASASHCVQVEAVHNGSQADMPCVFFMGTYTSNSVFSLGTWGLRV